MEWLEHEAGAPRGSAARLLTRRCTHWGRGQQRRLYTRGPRSDGSPFNPLIGWLYCTDCSTVYERHL